jgi:formate dehydrogenase major subunit
MGSNMAEQHPVGFQWVIEAKERGAKVIHVDPRFTRTSAMADLHVPLRPGTDIAFLGGLINHVLSNGREFREYVTHFTNARAIIDEGYRDTDDLGGLFSGWHEDEQAYDISTWGYAGTDGETAGGGTMQTADVSGDQSHGAHGMDLPHGHPPEEDWSLQDPNCVFQILKRHYARYTPEMVERVTGVPAAAFERIAEWMCDASGPDRTAAVVYSVGWTQHTTGVQNIRAASILQLLLGNVGRPGGGVMALRGHANIQGSTDIPTLFDILPGYIPMPHPQQTPTLDTFVEENGPDTGAWGDLRAYMVSLLKAWFGSAATEENDFCFGHLPRIDGDHSIYPTMLRMIDRECRGFFLMGQNPVVGSANSGLQRRALASLDWLVVRDLVEIESATFWREDPGCATEVFFLPAAAHTEKDGTFTNTQRLLQWHEKAVEPPGDCRSDLWFVFHLFRRIRQKLASSTEDRDRPIQDLTWDYTLVGETDDPDAGEIIAEIGGFKADGSNVSKYQELEADGSTSCGSWIHAGIHKEGVNQTARKKPHTEQNWIASEWGWAWPSNRRILYNRASARPDGSPWSERKKYVWWDPEQESWTSLGDDPDFVPDKAPDYEPPKNAKSMDAIRGDAPFILHPDGLGWLYAPAGLVDGPLPTHYEPHESPVENPLYRQDANPTRQTFERDDNPYNPEGDAFPHVLTTYRLTEHHTAGGMSRTVPYLAELQPELFVEVSPQLAQHAGLEHAGWATITTSRSAIEARVMVTERLRPLTIDGRTIHVVGLPYHWGKNGVVTGDSANELLPMVLDNNVHIAEYKALTCNIAPGRRPR